MKNSTRNISQNKELKLAFFGTSDRSADILNALHQNFSLNLCVTKKDTVVGRKQVTKQTGVKAWAKKNNIPFLAINSLKDEEKEQVLNALAEAQVEIAVVADFSLMIPEEVLKAPKYGILNIHFSLLPKYRGASPVQFCILNNDKFTGVSFYLLDKGMDTGEVIFQFTYPLSGNEKSGELYQQLFYRSAELLPKVIYEYTSGSLVPKKQREEDATYTYSKTHPKRTFIYKEDAKIDWTATLAQIYATIRAYNPWPIAWTTVGDLEHYFVKNVISSKKLKKDLKIKVYKAHLTDSELIIDTLQLEGGNIIGWDDFVNGYLNKDTQN